MLICLEGVDGAGKSTLARQIADEIGDDRDKYYFHFSQPERHPLTEYESTIDWYEPGKGSHVVCDRYHWGEMIYSELYRNGSALGAAGWWHVEQYLKSRGGLMVHVTAPYELICDRLIERGEEYLQSRHVERVYNEFTRQRIESYNQAIVVDSPVSATDLDLILCTAARREGLVTTMGLHKSYVGPADPHTLLVGDRPNISATRPFHAAAFPPYPGTSGRYLIDEVILKSPAPDRYGLINSKDELDEPVNLLRAYRKLGKPRVVALGLDAGLVCYDAGVPHVTVHHPSYRMRFMRGHEAEYLSQIAGGPQLPVLA